MGLRLHGTAETLAMLTTGSRAFFPAYLPPSGLSVIMEPPAGSPVIYPKRPLNMMCQSPPERSQTGGVRKAAI